MENVIQGFLFALHPQTLIFIIIGCAFGIVSGALPGISAAMGVILLLPFTFGMDGITAISMLVACFAASTWGGTITAVLFATPGTPDSVMTVLDGYPLHQQGKGGKALGLTISASVIGGLLSGFLMLFLSVPLSRVGLAFSPVEYAAISLLGLTAIAGLGAGGSVLKTLISGCLGIALATFGTCGITGVIRFGFGSTFFMSGIHFIPVMIGAFALSEVYTQAMKERKVYDASVTKNIKVEFMTFAEFMQYKGTIFRSAVIGMFIGILPGAGGTIASILAYGEAVRNSKTPEKFGTGMFEGVIAPETSNSAASGGSMVPTMTLGVPGSGTTAVILGAFIMHGMRPGPLLFTTQPTILYSVFVALIVSYLLLFVGGIWGVRAFAQVSRLNYYSQGSIIVALCFLGTFALNNDLSNVWVMVIAGFVGYILKKYGFSVPALVLGMVLGPLIEGGFRRGIIITGGNWLDVFLRPIAGPIFLLCLIFVFLPQLKKLFVKVAGKKSNAS